MDYKEADIDSQWNELLKKLTLSFSKKPDLQSVLFLIGINELGSGPKTFTKEQKQDLMHIGNCKVLSASSHFELIGLDDDGWPHWKLIKNIPALSSQQQELYLKWHIIEYFKLEQNL